MAAVDSQLEPGRARPVPHRACIRWRSPGAVTLALFVALVVGLLIRHNDLPTRTDLRIAAVGFLVAALGRCPPSCAGATRAWP